jgi:indole-3-glycerol phosphate synthase
MNILNTIIAKKHKEVEERSELYPVKLLEKSSSFSSPTVSLKKYLLREDKSGIIAEIKRKSPSKGWINPYVSIERTSIGYMQAGASALSILTDKEFFGGSNEDLMVARKFNFCPILRKDFVVHEYQLIEAKSIGADVILLIAAALEPAQITTLTKIAHSLSLEVLLEVHSLEELNANLQCGADCIGVNNRNLQTFEVDLNLSRRLSEHIPDEFIKVAESGIASPQTVQELRGYGYKGFLMGEHFMRSSRPEVAAKDFIDALKEWA